VALIFSVLVETEEQIDSVYFGTRVFSKPQVSKKLKIAVHLLLIQ
jgi:hypothetical protein